MTASYTREQVKAAILAANPNAQLSVKGQWTASDDVAFNRFLVAKGSRVNRVGASNLDPYGFVAARHGFIHSESIPKWITDLVLGDSTETAEATDTTTADADTATVAVTADSTPSAEATTATSTAEATEVAQEPVVQDGAAQEAADQAAV